MCVCVCVFQTDISVHLPVTHFCMLHLILLSISFRFMKEHAPHC